MVPPGLPPPSGTVVVDANGWPTVTPSPVGQPVAASSGAPPAPQPLPAEGTPRSASKEGAGAAFFGGLIRKASDSVSQLQRNAGAAVNSVTSSVSTLQSSVTSRGVSCATAPPSATDTPAAAASAPTSPSSRVPPPFVEQCSAGTMAAMIFAESRARRAPPSPVPPPHPDGGGGVGGSDGGGGEWRCGGVRVDAQNDETARAANMAAMLFDSVN